MGETVCSPFAGIGSEVYMALKLGRRAVGCELKRSYFDAALKNLRRIEAAQDQDRLFPEHSDDWLRALGAQDAIKDEALAKTPPVGPPDF